MRGRTALVLASVLSLAGQVGVEAAEIRVLCSNGLRAVVETLAPEFEKASGHRLSVDFSSTATLTKRIQSGEAFDVTLLTIDAVDVLVEAGRLAPETRVELARSGIGVGYRSGGSRPDVSSPEALRQSLLRARSIVYTRDGASRPHIDRMLDSLGIAAAVGSRTSLLGPGEGPAWVARGQAEIVMTLVSEILPVAGVELAGPFPERFQSYLTFAAAASAVTAEAGAVQSFVTFLTRADNAVAYRKQGMEPRRGQTP
jgi:molybdate transport system substrate-binding protein